MKKWLGVFIVLGVVLSGLQCERAAAVSLQLRPMSIKTSLKPNENQKGYLDISNTDARAVTVVATVQAFRQINNKGDLEFYDDAAVKRGIVVDITSTQIGPHQTMRVYYALLGDSLPEGDISAAIFFQTRSDAPSGVVTSARVGMLLSIVNGSVGQRQAEITHLSVPFFQFGTTITGQYAIKNTSNATTGGGFFPEVSLDVQPFEQKATTTSSLVFPGIERTNTFSLSTNRFGFYALSVTYGASTKTVWVFVVSPIVLISLIGVGALLTGVVMWWLRRSRAARRNIRTRRHIL